MELRHRNGANPERVKELAKDLTKEEPRPAHVTLAGYELAARCLDKCRATIAGQQGDFTFGCPMDQMFFSEASLSASEFRDFVATGASDQEVEEWLEQRANAKR